MPGYIPQVDIAAMKASSDAGFAHIKANLDEKRAYSKEAKLCCDRCKKQENSSTALQACGRCRSVRYCSRECQVAHYKATHKTDCANFSRPPLCRAFNTTVCLTGCSYPETGVFGLGTKDGMGAWVSVTEIIDCRLATLPGGGKNEHDPNVVFAMTPGLPGFNGKFLTLKILVQNRSKTAKPMVVIGSGIVAVASKQGTPIIQEGKEPGETSQILNHYPDLGPVLALAKVGAVLTYFNGKALASKQPKSCPAIKDATACAVLLNVGEYAQFEVEFRAGGPNVTHDFQALELLSHTVIPCIPYDPKAKGPFVELLAQAANRDEVCEIRPLIYQPAVDAWYKDYKTKGQFAYIASHHGEARANLLGHGLNAIGEMVKAIASEGMINPTLMRQFVKPSANRA
ncbi:ubiquitin carboxyl-terminal hydrolase 18-like protein [Favolaschia claudopus]|uniref:Ubiquitin carboxyl-terminal hydrolase 18-like protein n=1 Tax=Favolaschia claudopus TaxID=2862362 RepID=A0AAW0C4C0_9AGAR